MKINIIAAIGQNNEIGLNNQLLWKSKSDLEHFKQLTLGKPIIMGRKTFESLPGNLPDRDHFVITRQLLNQKKEVVFITGLIDCLSMLSHYTTIDEVFIIGGASIFEQALPLADELHISHMDWTGEADTFFPIIDNTIWKEVYSKTTFQEKEITWTYRKYVKGTNQCLI